jgi:hypothetical protein
MGDGFPLKNEHTDQLTVARENVPTSEYPFELFLIEPERCEPTPDESSVNDDNSDVIILCPS